MSAAVTTWLDETIEREARWDADQHAIYEWFARGGGNLLVRARAGCGKTTTIIEGVSRAPERSILMAAFNAAIRDELQSRIPSSRVEAKTLHGLGFLYTRRAWRVDVKAKERANGLAVAAMEVGDDAPPGAHRIVRELHTKIREVDPWIENIQAVIDFASRFDLLPDPGVEAAGWTLERLAEATLRAVQLAKERTPIIDFADMIFLPLVHGWVRPMFDLVVIDEAQDMTVAQLALAVGSCRSRVAVVGDDKQAIYQFRGAETNGLDRLKSELEAHELGLKTTYRCARLIVEEARAFVPDFSAHASAPEGVVESRSFEAMLSEVRPGDFVLSRKNAPLVRVCVSLWKREVRAQIKGNEFGKGIVALIERWRPKSIDDLATKALAWKQKEVKRAAKLSDDAKAERVATVLDTFEIVATLLDDVDDLADFQRKLTSLFDDTPGVDVVMCSSVHRAKGLEADTVFLLRPTFRSDRDEELNIQYVAITRAKRRLVWVEGGI